MKELKIFFIDLYTGNVLFQKQISRVPNQHEEVYIKGEYYIVFSVFTNLDDGTIQVCVKDRK